MEIYSYHPQHSVLFMSENSKLRLRLQEFGRRAKTHGGGGFYNEETASVLSSRAVATHISISYADKVAFSLPGRFPQEDGVHEL